MWKGELLASSSGNIHADPFNFLINKTDRFPGTWALLPTLGVAFMIYGGGQAWPNRNLLAARPQYLRFSADEHIIEHQTETDRENAFVLLPQICPDWA